jgi:uncharacterized membrane protein YecN with MAPEG domain
MAVTLITAGLLTLMLLALTGFVVAGRLKFRIGLGDGGNGEMQKRIRIHANFIEYVPLALILLYLVETAAIGPGWLPAAMGTTLIIGRLSHAYGLKRSSGASTGRFAGTNLTILVLLCGAVAVLGRGLKFW